MVTRGQRVGARGRGVRRVTVGRADADPVDLREAVVAVVRARPHVEAEHELVRAARERRVGGVGGDDLRLALHERQRADRLSVEIDRQRSSRAAAHARLDDDAALGFRSRPGRRTTSRASDRGGSPTMRPRARGPRRRARFSFVPFMRARIVRRRDRAGRRDARACTSVEPETKSITVAGVLAAPSRRGRRSRRAGSLRSPSASGAVARRREQRR